MLHLKLRLKKKEKLPKQMFLSMRFILIFLFVTEKAPHKKHAPPSYGLSRGGGESPRKFPLEQKFAIKIIHMNAGHLKTYRR